MASSSSYGNYEVFLNFRGEDTRKSFTCYLYDNLYERKKIKTFIDDEELRQGDEISPALLNAIQGSTISVVIFSKDYASSKWCLNELVKILECKNKNGQIVIPVFYSVSPSDVRHQTGIFGHGFDQLKQQFKEKPEMVQKWRDALTETSHLAGHESSKFRHDAQLVNKIVEDILKKLEKITISTDSSNGLVGLNSRIEQIKPFLSMDLSDTVQIVGIWGMGGIGKTTLATAIFNQFSSKFEGRCFLSDVRRNSATGGGLEHLQKLMLSTILGEELEAGGPNIPQFTKERVRRTKVLIVLDDVNKIEQLEGLIGHLDQYGPGSRIVATTRDKRVLEKFRVEKIYRVNGLKFEEAFELFYNFAFKEKHCPEDFKRDSWKVVGYAGGNPLVLKVLASSLKSKRHWGNVLDDLNRICESDIHDIYDILKISFNELIPRVKSMFLDIACCFEGEDKDIVTRIFDDSESCGLNVLFDKSLVSISGNRLRMHDLLQEMGRQTVCQESEKEPGKRSRLWDPKEIRHVLKHNKELFDGLDYLPENLRYLHWDKYPLRTLPSSLKAKNIVGLSLRFSKIEQIWEGKKKAFKLKFVDLSHSEHLIRIPDLSEIPNLQRIYLSNCTNLVHVPSSKQDFKYFSWLDFSGCKSLRSFPSNLHFVCPVTINFSSCVNLTEFPKISGKITQLILSRSGIEEVPSSIECLTDLKRLVLMDCKRLKRISTRFCKLKSLVDLHLDDCLNLERFPEILKKMKRLKRISLQRTAITELPSSFENLLGLEMLSVDGCSKLEKLPESIGNLKSLRYIQATGSAISQLPSSVAESSYLSSLKMLSISDCAVMEIPQGIACLSSLEVLNLSGNNFESLPASMKQMLQLGDLLLRDCKMLQSLPEPPLRLKSLYLRNCFMLRSLPQLPLCLQVLEATNCKRLKSLPEIPSCLQEIDASVLEKLSTRSPYNRTLTGMVQNWPAIFFTFTNCLKLNEKANNKILADSRLRIRHMAIASLRLGFEKENNGNLKGTGIFLPGSEIPDWFSNRSSGSLISIQLPPHSFCRNFIGFALCAVLDFKQVSSDCWGNSVVGCRFYSEIKTLSETKHFRWDCNLGHMQYFIESDHVILGFTPCLNFGFPDGYHHTTVALKFIAGYKQKGYKIKRCGVCPVYANPSEIKANTFTLNFATDVWKLYDLPSASGTSDVEELEPSPNRICRAEQINTA